MVQPKKKPTTKAARAKSVLTERQVAVVEGTLDGLSAADTAAKVGYASTAPVSRALANPDVARALALAREELSDVCQIRRADIIEGFQDAIALARCMEDPASMIRGYTEIAKMLGLYAPEEKKITLTVGQQQMRGKFVQMSDADLLAMVNGQMTIDMEPPREH